MRMVFFVSSCLSQLKMASPIDSQVFRMTLPTKPSQTTTSTGCAKRSWPSMLPRKLSELCFEHLEDFLGEFAAFHVFLADRHQADGRVFVAEDVARINRAHDAVLHKVHRVAGRRSRRRRSGRKRCVSVGMMEAMPGRSTPGKRAELDRGRGDGGAGVAGADDGVGVALFHQIDRAADGGIFFPADGFDRFIRHLDDLRGVNDLDRGDRCSRVFSVRPRSAACRRRGKACRCAGIRAAPSRRRPRDWAGRNRRPWHRVRFSSGARVCGLSPLNAKRNVERGAASLLSGDSSTRRDQALRLAASTVSTWRPL